jgi:hypothetical protein
VDLVSESIDYLSATVYYYKLDRMSSDDIYSTRVGIKVKRR